VIDVARTIAELYHQQPELRFRAARVGEIKHSFGSPAMVTEALGLTRMTGLSAGLQEVLRWLDASENVMTES
jgi:hypothetical protein